MVDNEVVVYNKEQTQEKLALLINAYRNNGVSGTSGREVLIDWGQINEDKSIGVLINDSILKTTFEVIPNEAHPNRFVNLVMTNIGEQVTKAKFYGYIMDNSFAEEYHVEGRSINGFRGAVLTQPILFVNTEINCDKIQLDYVMPEDTNYSGSMPDIDFGGASAGDSNFNDIFIGVYNNLYGGSGGGEFVDPSNSTGGSHGNKLFWMKVGDAAEDVWGWITGLFGCGSCGPKPSPGHGFTLIEQNAFLLVNPIYGNGEVEEPEEENPCQELAVGIMAYSFSFEFVKTTLGISQADLFWLMLRQNQSFFREAVGFLNDEDFSSDALAFFHEALQIKKEGGDVDFVEIFNNTYDENKPEISLFESILTLNTLGTDVPWHSNQGVFNNVPALAYTHTRTIMNNGRSQQQYLLASGDILTVGDYGEGSESVIIHWYFSQEMQLWFQIPEPTNYNNLSLDFLWDGFWDATITGTRYCTPFEDVIILVGGKDFEGVAQSRATAGLFILVDLVPGGKVIKVTKKAGHVLSAASPIVKVVIDATTKSQKALKKQYKDIIALASSGRKGNFGEICTDIDFVEKGYEVVHVNRHTTIDPIVDNTGIDHIFKNPVTGEYVIVESKFHGTGGLSNLSDGTRQMSNDWISNGLENNTDRLWKAVGGDMTLYNDITNNGFERVVGYIQANGTINYKYVGADGYEINTVFNN